MRSFSAAVKTRRVRFSAGGTDSPAVRDLAGLDSGDVTDGSCRRGAPRAREIFEKETGIERLTFYALRVR
jgi:hypothetical protein